MDEKIIIVGGGICGLTTSIALQKQGYDVTVFEKSNELGEVGAGITLWHNATSILKDLNVYSELLERGSGSIEGSIFTKNGKLLSQPNVEDIIDHEEVTAISIHRAELQKILYEKAGSDNVFLGKEIINYTQDEDIVTVEFVDGSKEVGNLLFAADGINSRIRSIMHEGKWNKRYHGYTAYRGLVASDNFAIGKEGEYWGRGKRFGFIKLKNDLIYWFATVTAQEDKVVKKNNYKSILLENFEDWVNPIPTLISSTTSDNIIRNNIYDLKPNMNWYDGRVLLIGDAVHATTPNLGQGACMAIEDAAVLSDLLIENDYSDAFRKFVDQRFERTKMVIKQSNRIGKMGKWKNSFSVFIRNSMTKYGSFYMDRFLGKILNGQIN